MYVYSLIIIYVSIYLGWKHHFFLPREIHYPKSSTNDVSTMTYICLIQCFENWSFTFSQLGSYNMHMWDRQLRWLDHPLELLLGLSDAWNHSLKLWFYNENLYQPCIPAQMFVKIDNYYVVISTPPYRFPISFLFFFFNLYVSIECSTV